MNGQMYQICSIVAAGRKALQSGEPIKYVPTSYEHSTTFSFLPEKKFFGTRNCIAPDVSTWFEHMKGRGLQNIKFLCPISVKNRQLLGFSNTTESSIFCFLRSGKVSYFVPDWKFDREKRQWNILYSEQWVGPPMEKSCFEDNTDSFRQVLLEIKNLADQIECEDFARIFGSAISILDGGKEYPDEKYGLTLPPIPQENLQLFEAASLADVFGAMGSWNDSPPYMAHEKGLDKEYEQLSNELLKNIRLALLYAVNEW